MKKILPGSLKDTRLNLCNAPIAVYWESTRACDLNCRHCRAEAIKDRDENELSTEEVRKVFCAVKKFGTSFLVITGGDPIKRPDLFELLNYAKSIGLNVSITPSGTNSISYEHIRRFREAGVQCVALSIDGATTLEHDTFRNVVGCFRSTVRVAEWVVAEGMPLQINTTVADETVDSLSAIFDLVNDLNAKRWSVFFLVPVGRGAILKQISPQRCEDVLEWLFDLSRKSGLAIKTTEAHHYRRIAIQSLRRQGRVADVEGSGVRDGSGVMFVSHIGDIYPSGFLPIKCGNVLKDDLVEVYRDSKVFRDLRDESKLIGKCGLCEFKKICGGSRARAYALTGNYLESDPLCSYEPLNKRACIA